MYTKKFNKKPLLTALALVLVCVVSVMGTMAYLTATTEEVVNTFTAATLLDPLKNEFVLKEHEVTTEADGTYTIGSKEVLTNDYIIYPGVTLPKDPFVRVEGLTANAYLFVEIDNDLVDGLSFGVNAANWTVTNLTGRYGGTVYVYKGGNPISSDLDADDTYILAGEGDYVNGQVEVAPTIDPNTVTDYGRLTFYGYLLQATGFADYTAAWEAVYPATP